ncbi:MAG: hypothetical protein K2X82_22170, partial [Gemmataceae bacterium]|nr:hypothetical protein [Gemmataceae bacterium]
MSDSPLDRIRAEARVGSRITLLLNNGNEKSGVILDLGPTSISLLGPSNRRLTLQEGVIAGWEVEADGDAAVFASPPPPPPPPPAVHVPVPAVTRPEPVVDPLPPPPPAVADPPPPVE